MKVRIARTAVLPWVVLCWAIGSFTPPAAAAAAGKAPVVVAPPQTTIPAGEGAPAGGTAATGGAAGAATEGAANAPEALPAYAIPSEAEMATARVARIPDPSVPEPVLEEARRSIAEVERALDAIDRDRRRMAESLIATVDLEDWRQQYLRLDRTLDERGAALRQVAESTDAEIAALDRMAQQWEVTAQSIASETLPAVIGERIAAVRAQIATGIGRLRAHRMALLEILIRIADLRGTIGESVRALGEALAAEQQKLFVIESAPLWSVLVHPPQRLATGREVLDAWRDVSRTVARFLEESRGAILLHFALFAAIVGATLALSARTARPQGDRADLALPARILARPVQTSLLVALLLTPSIHRHA